VTGASQPSRIGGLDLLRALAALMVLVCHVMDMGGLLSAGLALWLGRTGRCLFLVLSGFLLFLPYARAAYAPGAKIDAAAYALKRVLRLLPLYVTAVLVFALIGVFRHWPDNGKNLLYHLLFVHIYDPATFGGLSGPLWFIAVIAHWYVVLPFIGWAWLKLRHRLVVWSAVALALAAAHAVAWTVQPLSPTAFRIFLDKSFLGALPFLFAGMMGAALLARARAHGAALQVLSTPLALPAAFVLLGVLVAFNAAWSHCAAPLILAVVTVAFAAGDVRVAKPIRAFGRMSYSVFVTHTAVLIIVLRVLERSAAFRAIDHPWLRTALIFAAGLGPILAVATASYRLLERPFMRLRPATPRRVLVRLAAAYASLLLISASLYFFSVRAPGAAAQRRALAAPIEPLPRETVAIHAE
jgi:peptidoglycan/LPS O-acetylase OafA/YrhL